MHTESVRLIEMFRRATGNAFGEGIIYGGHWSAHDRISAVFRTTLSTCVAQHDTQCVCPDKIPEISLCTSRTQEYEMLQKH